jgi:hypothetical protein
MMFQATGFRCLLAAVVLGVLCLVIGAQAQTAGQPRPVRAVGNVADGEVVVWDGDSGLYQRSSGSTNLPNYLGTLSVATGQIGEIEGRTNAWNQAATDGTSATGRLVVIEGRTNAWNSAGTDATAALAAGLTVSGRVTVVEANTNRWLATESALVTVSGRVAVVEGRTNAWNQAATDGTSATGRLVVIEGRTNTWNAAFSGASAPTNASAALRLESDGSSDSWISPRGTDKAIVVSADPSGNYSFLQLTGDGYASGGGLAVLGGTNAVELWAGSAAETFQVRLRVTASEATFNGAPLAWSRYQAYADSASTVDVLASGTGVTAAVGSSLITFTIPAKTRVASARVRWNGAVSTYLVVDVGTNDMVNGTWTNRWAPTVSGWNESTGADVTLTRWLDTTNFARVMISGMTTSVWNGVKLDW